MKHYIIEVQHLKVMMTLLKILEMWLGYWVFKSYPVMRKFIGGKTICLRTVGLAAMMEKSGATPKGVLRVMGVQGISWLPLHPKFWFGIYILHIWFLWDCLFALKHLDGRQLLMSSNPGEVIKPDQYKTIDAEGMPQHSKPLPFLPEFSILPLPFKQVIKGVSDT